MSFDEFDVMKLKFFGNFWEAPDFAVNSVATVSTFKILSNTRNYVDHFAGKEREEEYYDFCKQIGAEKHEYTKIYCWLIKRIADELNQLIVSLLKFFYFYMLPSILREIRKVYWLLHNSKQE